MGDERRSGQDPAEAGREDVERANEHAERRMEELRQEVQREIDRTDAVVKDRDEVGERPVPPGGSR
jgi:hypothetical protein